MDQYMLALITGVSILAICAIAFVVFFLLFRKEREKWEQYAEAKYGKYDIVIAYLEKYNQNEEPISLFRTLKYQIPYSVCVGLFLLLLVIGWFLVGIPIGIPGAITT